jgi:hypothetical protein
MPMTSEAPLTVASSKTADAFVRPSVRIAWIELTCLPCGAIAGYIENGRIVRPNSPDGIRLLRGRLRCGRCDGALLAGDRGVALARGQIGY